MSHFSRLVLVFVAHALLLHSQIAHAVIGLKFEEVFHSNKEPNFMHFKVEFQSNGTHELEVWRSGQIKIKRLTDDVLETYAVKKSKDEDYYLSVLDLKRKIHTQINRTNLIRIGNFSDWFDLGHGLKHPLGEYELIKLSTPPQDAQAVTECQWYALSQNNQTTNICWSTKAHLPLVIQNAQNKTLWKISSWDTKLIEDREFIIHDEGFVKNNANEDIDHD